MRAYPIGGCKAGSFDSHAYARKKALALAPGIFYLAIFGDAPLSRQSQRQGRSVLRDWNTRAGEMPRPPVTALALPVPARVFWPSLEGFHFFVFWPAWQARLILKRPCANYIWSGEIWRNTRPQRRRKTWWPGPSHYPQWKRSEKRGRFTIASNWLTSRP